MDSKRSRQPSVILVGLATTAALVAAPASRASAAPVAERCTSYTVDAEFDLGELFDVNHDAPNNDQLQLNSSVSTFPVMWIANAGEDSLSKVDTDTGRQLARYYTWAPRPSHLNNAYSGPAPSRTAVDSEGNAYVANRHFDGRPASVMKVLVDRFIDRNGDGILQTSSDLDNDGIISGGEILPLVDTNGNGRPDPSEIQDERIEWIVEVGPNAGLGRSLCIDKSSHLWVGLFNRQEYYKISSVDGAILAGPVATPGHSPYGCLVDKNGMLWSASLGSTLGQIDTNADSLVAVRNHSAFGSDYGIALGNDRVYQATYSGFTYIEYNPATNTFSNPAQAPQYSALGIGTDSSGNIFAGNSSSGGVSKFRPDGTRIWTAPGQVGTGQVRGVVVDRNDDVWLIHLTSHVLSKHRGSDGAALGVFPIGNSPYTYTDATGLGSRTNSAASGDWTVVQDGGQAGNSWGTITWNTEPEGNVPPGADITVEARTADTEAGLQSQSFVTVSNGTPFALTGRFIEVRATLSANQANESPILSDIEIESTQCTLQTCGNGQVEGTEQCDDGNTTDGDCCSSSCLLDPDGSNCSDGNTCTTADTCSAGVCSGGPPLVCNDGNACTDDVCDPTSGCASTPNNAPCDDGNACTTGDVCSAGTCSGGAPQTCDDGNVCTNDYCEPGVGCIFAANRAPCDDGNACTTADTCSARQCRGGPPLTCDDGNVCTDDSCDVAQGCVYSDNNAPCDDGNACTTADTCSARQCHGGPPRTCDDGNVCTDDFCDDAQGCVYTDNSAPCDDGDGVVCPVGDFCQAGACVSGGGGDTDGDGICDEGDSCPEDPGEQTDFDEDGVGDPCDNCKCEANADQEDADGDGAGDACDLFPDTANGLCVVGPITEPVGPLNQGILVPQKEVVCLELPGVPVHERCL